MVLKKRFTLIVFLISLLFVLFSTQTLAVCTSNCPDGYGCYDSRFCLSGNCVNNICCEAGKTCCSSSYGSQCPSGYFCGPQYYCVQKKAWGSSCTSDYECQPGYCTNNVCCDAMTTCCTSSNQCGTDMICSSGVCKWACETKVGGCCFSDSDCPSGYECNKYATTEFQWGECTYVGGTTPLAYCGDGSCNGGETCSSCSSDCGVCSEWKVDQGHSCRSDSECEGGLWCNWFIPGEMSSNGEGICCEYGKGCCDSPSGEIVAVGSGIVGRCNPDYTFTLVENSLFKKTSGQSCSSDSECETGLWCNWLEPGKLYDGKTGVCCKTGKGCCDSPYVVYNIASGKVGTCELDFTITIWEDKATGKKANGQSCSSNSECQSGWCDDVGLGNKDNCKIKEGELFGGCKTAVCCEYGKKCCTEDGGCIVLVGASYRCNPQNYCSEPGGLGESGYACESDQFCKSGNCIRSICCESGKLCCSTDSDCPAGASYVCNSTVNYCQTTECLRAVCCTDEQCGEGYECIVDKQICVKKSKAGDIVTSIYPEDDQEAREIEKLIEDQIYPAIVKIFDENSNKVFTDQRDYDPNIKLRMTDKETIAMWDESTNVMTIPYRNMYENFGSFSPKNMQLNGIAHELTHYHFNGFALKGGGDFKKIPLWFREGIAEYGAHKYYKKYLQGEVPLWSVSESRSNIFINYLATNPKLYKETVQKDAIDKVAWKSEGNWDKNINQYSHVYYGAVFNFINYFLSKSTYKEDESMIDIMKYMFITASKGKFKFYTSVGSENVAITEQNIKNDWFNDLDTNHKIKENLDNKPPNIVKRFFTGVGDFFRNLFNG